MQPVELPEERRETERCDDGDCEPEMTDAATGCARLERAQRQQEQRHPLDENGERPRRAGSLHALSLAERERRRDERHHQRVVVAATCEVHRDQRVPADERSGEGAARATSHVVAQHAERRGRTEEPRRQTTPTS